MTVLNPATGYDPKPIQFSSHLILTAYFPTIHLHIIKYQSSVFQTAAFPKGSPLESCINLPFPLNQQDRITITSLTALHYTKVTKRSPMDPCHISLQSLCFTLKNLFSHAQASFPVLISSHLVIPAHRNHASGNIHYQ
jgi:hypothetical protein